MSIKKLKEQHNIVLDQPIPNQTELSTLKSMFDIEHFKNALNYRSSSSIQTLGEHAELFFSQLDLPYFLIALFVKHDTVLTINPEHINIDLNVKQLKVWIEKYDLRSTSQTNRDQALYLLIKDLFDHMINPLVFNSVRLTNIKSNVIYDIIINKIAASLSGISDLNEKNDYLKILNMLKEEKNEFFYDPFNFELKEVYIEGFERTIKVRKSCCMRYMMKGQNRCNTCPQKYVKKIDITR